MVQVLKGEIVLTEKDFNNLQEQIIDGKKYYVLKTNERKEPVLNKEEINNMLKNNQKRIDIIEYFKCTEHYFNKFLKKEYGTMSIKDIRKQI